MKISIIGVGAVGVGICQNLLNLGDYQEIVLVDLNKDRSEGEALDFSHTSALSYAKNTKVYAGDYEDTVNSDIVVITAGAQIKVGQDRLELAQINSPIAVDIAKKLWQYAPNAILIVVTNPCDILTHFIIANTPYSPNQVISAGCVIDSARLMKIISHYVKVDPKNVFGMVWGEHGSGSVIPWGLVQVAGQSLDDYCMSNGLPIFDKAKLLAEVKQAGIDIFNRKLNTNHGIAASVFRIIRAITIDEHSVLPVGVLMRGEYGIHNVVLNIPCVIARTGIVRQIHYNLTQDDIKALQATATHLRNVIQHVVENTKLLG